MRYSGLTRQPAGYNSREVVSLDQIPVILSLLASGSTLAVNLYLWKQARKGRPKRKRGRHRK